MRTSKLVLLVTVASTAMMAFPSREAAAAAFVNRPITLPRSEWSLDFGLGIGHFPRTTGAGINLEMAAGLTSFVQLGIRTGIRIGSEGRATQADRYGRTFETETYGTYGDTVANPEISLKWALVHSTAELALDMRLYLPTEDNSHVGVMIGLPINIHLGGSARLDTGIFVPISFEPTRATVSFPLHLWIQASRQLYLGPLTGVKIHPGGGTSVPLGFGIGGSVSYDVDLKTWILFPDVSGEGSAKAFGAGVGLQVRF